VLLAALPDRVHQPGHRPVERPVPHRFQPEAAAAEGGPDRHLGERPVECGGRVRVAVMPGVFPQHRAQPFPDRHGERQVGRPQSRAAGQQAPVGQPVAEPAGCGQSLVVDLRLVRVDEVPHQQHGGWHRLVAHARPPQFTPA
jgi:hypothetical protein